jgi:Flp pilus assembly protein TadD
VNLQRAYDAMERAEELGRAGDETGAAAAFGEALELAPGAPEIRFWLAVGLAHSGRREDARGLMTSLAEERPQWAELLRRLPAAGAFPGDPELLRAIDPGS